MKLIKYILAENMLPAEVKCSDENFDGNLTVVQKEALEGSMKVEEFTESSPVGGDGDGQEA